MAYLIFDRFGKGYGGIPRDREREVLYMPFPYLDKLRWIEPAGARARTYVEKLGRIVDSIDRGKV